MTLPTIRTAIRHGLRAALGIGAAFLLLASCQNPSHDSPPGQGTVNLSVSVTWPIDGGAGTTWAALYDRPLLAPPGVANMRATVAVGPFNSTKKTAAGAGSDTISNVPPGPGTLTLDALDSGDAVLYSGASSFSGQANTTVPLTVDMTVAPNAKVAPWPPTGVTATAGGTTTVPTVTLTWNAAAGATSYNTYRGAATGAGVSGTKFAAVKSGLLDNTVTTGTEYFYVVTALNGTLESGASGESSAKTAGTAPPATTTTTTTTTSSNPTTAPTVAISNAVNNQKLYTGFLVGTVTAVSTGATISGVSILDTPSGGTATSLTATVSGTSWSLKIPTSGTTRWKPNGKHVIQAKAIDSFGNSASTSSITVFKAHNHDINGDGYPDVAVGAPGQLSVSAGATTNSTLTGDGAVYIYNGGSGLGASASKTIAGISSGKENFGYAVALGDVNGDGYADLVVGAPSYQNSTPLFSVGRVYVFHGASGGIAATGAGSASTMLSGTTNAQMFGAELALGDANGDGFDDLMVGTPGFCAPISACVSFWAVYGYQSSSSGVASGSTANDTNAKFQIVGSNSTQATSLTTNALLSLAMGDVNGDGYEDLLIGDGNNATQTGILYPFHGSANGLVSGTGTSALSSTSMFASTNAAVTTITGASTNDKFGFTLAVGDVSGDGIADVAVGALNPSTSSVTGCTSIACTGSVYVFSGVSSSGLPTSRTSATQIFGPSDSTNTASYGAALALGDTNLDGNDDLLVGTRVGAGSVYYFRANSAGGFSTNLTAATATATLSIGALDTSINSAQSLALLPLRTNGQASAVVGAANANATGGAVFEYTSTGSTSTSSLNGAPAVGSNGSGTERRGMGVAP